jgi:hypothetical protein
LFIFLLLDTLTAEEDIPGKPQVAVLTSSAWQRLFGSVPQIVGKSIIVDGAQATVVGVLTAEFTLTSEVHLSLQSVQAWGDNASRVSAYRVKGVARLRIDSRGLWHLALAKSIHHAALLEADERGLESAAAATLVISSGQPFSVKD